MEKIRQLSTYVAFALAILILGESCASSTNIFTEPKGADVYLNGIRVGKTPYTMTDTKIVGSITQLTLKKEGYEDMNVTIARNEELDVGALIGGILVLIPFLWIQKYSPVHQYTLTPLGGTTPLDAPKRRATPVPTTTSGSKADRLRELKQLLDEGLITKEDYEKAKAKILEEN